MHINKISIINKLYFNRFTKAGRERKDFIESLEEKGCNIIRERKSKCDTTILGYKNEFTPLANYAVKIAKDGSFIYKHSDALYSPIPSSNRYYKTHKIIVDKDGNTEIVDKKMSVVRGKVDENFTKRTLYETGKISEKK